MNRLKNGETSLLAGLFRTDMTEGIVRALDLRPSPDVVVVVTDGYTPWPEEAPRQCRVVVALVGEAGPDAPQWSHQVRVS